MSIHLYWNLASQPSRSIKALLLAGGVEHEESHLDIMKGEHKTPEYMKIHPNGQIPCITVDGEAMTESAAILRYLAQKFPDCNKFYDGTLEQKQKIDQMLDYSATSFRPNTIAGLGPRVVKAVSGAAEFTPAQQAMIDSAPEKMIAGFESLEKHLANNGGTKFTCGDNMSIADLQLYFEATNGVMFNFDFSKYEKVTVWMAACKENEAVKGLQDKWDTAVVPAMKAFVGM